MIMLIENRPTVRRVWLWSLPLLALALALAGGTTATGTELQAARMGVSVRKGICVVLGLPKAGRPESVTELAGGTELLIYFQSAKSDQVAEVRRVAEAAGLLGDRIFVEQADWKSIPLADNLADAVIVAPGTEESVSEEEILRVLHPGGTADIGDKKIVKPVPPGIDAWPYPYHGPDNNPQSLDSVARAPYLTQFIAEPKFGPSPAVTVAAGGRIFRAFGHLSHKENQNAMINTLVAANAYNGMILWKRPLSDGFMVLRNTIIATRDTLYLADDKSCKLLDAASGELKDEIVPPGDQPDGTVWKWMALEGDTLYGLLGAEEFKAAALTSDSFGMGGWPRANWPGFDYQDPKTAWGQGRTLVAIDVKTKKLLWQHRERDYVDGRAVCMSGGRIFLLSPEKFLASVDARSGEVLWKTADADLLAAIGPLFTPAPRWTGLSPFPYVRCNEKFLFFSGPRMPRIVTVSTDDGKLAWQKDVPMIDGGSVHLLLRDDAIYAIGHGPGETSFTMDYETGEIGKRFLGRRACTIATGTVDSIFYRAPGGTVRLDLASGIEEHIAPMRPPCYEGVIVSGGLLYWGPWKCRCQLSLYGHIALASAGDSGGRALPDESRLVLGSDDPASVEKFPVDANDWPCYQGDNGRTAATRVAIPKQVSQRWAFQLPAGALPTAPVAAGGLVFVGDRNGLVRALDAADGTPRWKAYTAAGIFFPPAVWEGRLYVGSADGYVYAFEAASGRLLWKFLAAPTDRRIPVFGKLISTWPVAGGVVVQNGTVYAAAGIAHYDGTHVYALDAVSGKVRWHNGTSGSLAEEVNNGISLQGSLRVAGGQLQFCGGNAYPLASYDLATGKCTTAANPRAGSPYRTAFYPYYPRHGRYTPLNHTLADGRSLNYAADYSGALHSALALVGPLPPGVKFLRPLWRIPIRGQKPKGTPEVLWEDKSRAKFTGFVVGPGALVTAGETVTQAGTKPFLASVNIEDGSQQWRKELPAAVVKSGVAVDHQARIIVALEDGRVLCFAGNE